MSVALSPQPMFQAFAPNGQFLVGGQLSTFAAGTSTPQVTYVDSTQTTPNANPIILNSLGQASVWLVGQDVYKLVLKDSAGNQIWSVDNVPGGANFVNIVVNGIAGVALTVNGANSFYSEIINGGSSTGGSFGLQVQAGTNATDTAVNIETKAGAPILVANGQGNVTIGPPTTGAALTINNVAGGDAIDVNINQAVGAGFLLNATGSSTAFVRGINIRNSLAASPGGTFGVLVGNDTTNTFIMGKTSTGNPGTAFTNGIAGDVSFLQSGGGAPMIFVAGTTNEMTIGFDSFARAQITMFANLIANGNITTTGNYIGVGGSFSGAVGINAATPPAPVTGWGTPTGGAAVANFPGAGPATLAQCSTAIAEIIFQLKAFGLFGA